MSSAAPSDAGSAAAGGGGGGGGGGLSGGGETPVESVRFSAVATDYNDLPTFPSRPSYKEFHSSLDLSTQCVVFEGAPQDPHKPSSVPIYQTATFVQPSSTEFGAYDYTRSGNPTRTALEKQVAMLEGAHAAFAFGSGMAALAAVTRLLKVGDELRVGEDIYGGMHRLVSRVTGALHGVRVTFVDTTDLAKVRAAITPATRMLHMETPSNPMMRITDVRALAALLRGDGRPGSRAPILLSIDSTMMSPILQRPISLGADIVVHSATKFFGGHSDVMGGLVCLRDADLSKRIAFFQNAEGSGLDPQSCWLFMRGIKTLALRVERAQETAMEVARFLAGHARVKRLYFPGMPPRAGDDAAATARCLRDNDVHRSQSRGSGCVMSFETGEVAISRRFIDSLRIFKLTVSFGSVNSLCEMPCMLSHASIPADQRTLPDDLVRLSIGIESASDIIADISQAFELAQHPHVVNVRSVRRRDTQDEKELFRLASLAAAAAAAAGAETPAGAVGAAGAVGGATPLAAGAIAATLEDAAAVSRGEVRKLQDVVRFLKERLAESEEYAADVRARLESGAKAWAGAGAPGGPFAGAGGARGPSGGGRTPTAATVPAAAPVAAAAAAPAASPASMLPSSLIGGASLVVACALAAAVVSAGVSALSRKR